MRGGLDDALDKLARRDELRRRTAGEATGTPPAVQELVEAIVTVVGHNPKLAVTVGVEGAGDPVLLHFAVEDGTVQVSVDNVVASRVAEAAPPSPRHADFDLDVLDDDTADYPPDPFESLSSDASEVGRGRPAGSATTTGSGTATPPTRSRSRQAGRTATRWVTAGGTRAIAATTTSSTRPTSSPPSRPAPSRPSPAPATPPAAPTSSRGAATPTRIPQAACTRAAPPMASPATCRTRRIRSPRRRLRPYRRRPRGRHTPSSTGLAPSSTRPTTTARITIAGGRASLRAACRRPCRSRSH